MWEMVASRRIPRSLENYDKSGDLGRNKLTREESEESEIPM